LKSLSVSLSDPVIFRSRRDAERSYDPAEEIDLDLSGEERNIDDVTTEVADECNFIGLPKLLQLSSELEDLEIHQYRLRLGAFTPHLYGERLLHRTAQIDTPSNLRRMELRGLSVREEDLLAFIERTGVRKLFMYTVSMSIGTFRSIFDYCASELAGMEKIYFTDLFQGVRGFISRGLEIHYPKRRLVLVEAIVTHWRGQVLRSSSGFIILRGLVLYYHLLQGWNTPGSSNESMGYL
jgi:hypothetical protein